MEKNDFKNTLENLDASVLYISKKAFDRVKSNTPIEIIKIIGFDWKYRLIQNLHEKQVLNQMDTNNVKIRRSGNYVE